jgi:hypothetical protein
VSTILATHTLGSPAPTQTLLCRNIDDGAISRIIAGLVDGAYLESVDEAGPFATDVGPEFRRFGGGALVSRRPGDFPDLSLTGGAVTDYHFKLAGIAVSREPDRIGPTRVVFLGLVPALGRTKPSGTVWLEVVTTDLETPCRE